MLAASGDCGGVCHFTAKVRLTLILLKLHQVRETISKRANIIFTETTICMSWNSLLYNRVLLYTGVVSIEVIILAGEAEARNGDAEGRQGQFRGGGKTLSSSSWRVQQF